MWEEMHIIVGAKKSKKKHPDVDGQWLWKKVFLKIWNWVGGFSGRIRSEVGSALLTNDVVAMTMTSFKARTEQKNNWKDGRNTNQK